MTSHGVTAALGEHAFLKDLSERHRMLLAAGVRPFQASAGDLLAAQGTTADEFYLVQSGQATLGIQVPGRGLVPIQTVGPNEIIGWSWLVPPHRWQFEARADSEVRGLVFDGNWLRERCDQDHELAYLLLARLVAVISARLAATRIQLLDVYR